MNNFISIWSKRENLEYGIYQNNKIKLNLMTAFQIKKMFSTKQIF